MFATSSWQTCLCPRLSNAEAVRVRELSRQHGEIPWTSLLFSASIAQLGLLELLIIGRWIMKQTWIPVLRRRYNVTSFEQGKEHDTLGSHILEQYLAIAKREHRSKVGTSEFGFWLELTVRNVRSSSKWVEVITIRPSLVQSIWPTLQTCYEQ